MRIKSDYYATAIGGGVLALSLFVIATLFALGCWAAAMAGEWPLALMAAAMSFGSTWGMLAILSATIGALRDMR